MSDHYILKDKEPVEVDLMTWAKWFGNSMHERIVGQDKYGEIFVSTVFLGLNHQWDEGKSPLLFETMVFGGEHDQYQQRYSTWNEAEAGHLEVCKLVNMPDVLEAEFIG